MAKPSDPNQEQPRAKTLELDVCTGVFFFFFFQLTSRKCETFVRNTYKLFLLGNAPSWILSAMQSDPYRVESLSRTTASLSTVCACDIRKIPQFKALKARQQPWSLGPPAIFLSRLLFRSTEHSQALDASHSLMRSQSWSVSFIDRFVLVSVPGSEETKHTVYFLGL